MPDTLIIFGLLALEIIILLSIALSLHALSPRYGVSLLLMYVAAIVSLLTYAAANNVLLEPIDGIVMTVPGDQFITTILSIVLVLYVVDGTRVAQTVIFGIALIQVLVSLAFIIVATSDDLPTATPASGDDVFTDVIGINVRLMFAGVIAFVIDMLAVAIVYQGTWNLLRCNRHWQWLAVATAMMGALWTDAIIFNFLGSGSTTAFVEFLPGDIVSKSIGALVAFPPIALYLTFIAPRLPHIRVRRPRPTFDIINGLFGNLRHRILTLEAELRDRELNTAFLISNINEIFWIADPSHTDAYYVNGALATITGITPQEFYDNPASIIERIHPDDRDRVATQWLRFVSVERELEFRLIDADGNIHWMRDNTSLIQNEQSRLLRVVGITKDVSDQVERMALQHQITLEHEKLEFLNGMVRDISHDLRTPITSIGLKLELLDYAQDDAELQQEYLADLKQQTDQFGKMVEDLFALLRFESQSIPLPHQLSLDAIVHSVVVGLRLIAEKNNLTIDVSLAADTQQLRCNEFALYRAISNIISNAIRYTPEGNSISVVTSESPTSSQLVVSDTGIGISAEDLPRIFERFYRASNAQTLRGTGLGLAITKEIIAGHGGSISVESTLDVGTTFTITLPTNTPTPPPDP